MYSCNKILPNARQISDEIGPNHQNRLLSLPSFMMQTITHLNVIRSKVSIGIVVLPIIHVVMYLLCGNEVILLYCAALCYS